MMIHNLYICKRACGALAKSVVGFICVLTYSDRGLYACVCVFNVCSVVNIYYTLDDTLVCS